MADDTLDGVPGERDEVLNIDGGDEVEGFAEFEVRLLDARELVVGAAELAAAKGKLVARLTVGKNPGTQRR